MHNHFLIDEQKKQTVNYNLPNMPILFGDLHLKNIPNYAISGHWHEDIEFILVLKGEMILGVNGAIHTLQPETGVIINSNQIHFILSAKKRDCHFLSFLISPSLLTSGADLYAHYIKKSYFDVLILDKNISWQSSVISDITRLFYACSAQEKCYELYIRGIFFQVWAQVCRYMPSDSLNKKSNAKSICLKQMLHYIHDNYQNPITLDEICQAGAVSKSVCFRIFNDFLLQTPFSYLMQYRVERSLILLRDPDITISEIAYENGFSGASYYAEVFRKYYNMSPSEYRRKNTPDVYPSYL